MQLLLTPAGSEWSESRWGSRPAARGRFGTGPRPRVIMEAKGEENGTLGRGEKRICLYARVFPSIKDEEACGSGRD